MQLLYFINLDERGLLYADVRDETGRTLLKIDFPHLFEDGYMEHEEDSEGLLDFLILTNIAPKGATIERGN